METKTKKKSKKGVFGNVLLTIGPMSLWTVLFFVFPFIYIILVSFCSRDQFGNIVYSFSLGAYKTLTKAVYLQVIFRTLKMAAIVTVLVTLIAYPYAYFCSRASKKIQNLLIIAVMIPFWINSLLRIYAIMNFTSKNGLINNFLMGMGIIKEPIQILYTTGAVYFGLVYSLVPMMVMPLYSCLEKIDPAVLEAGRDLGCSSGQLFRKVIFPLSIPGIMGGLVLVFVPAMFNFYIADALGGGKTIIIGNLISSQFSTAKNWPLGAALSVVVMVISTAVIMIKNKIERARSY
ncbi:MAG: ABC transporter permease [Lachnospiraceae bacterium]|nr:ABC transporter permease [Clostridium sp.]MDD6178931.1 ABC transporter permease [Clostridium sp.]MDY4821530.1 ABC transporter permease [Lachnospiraceae bacterium]